MISVADLIDRTFVRYPQNVAVVDGERSETVAQVEDRVRRLANAIAALTPEAAPRVGVLLRNSLEYIEIDLAITLAGATKVPINPRLSDDERAFIINDSGASLLFTEEAELERVLDHRSDCPALESVVNVGRPRPGVHDYEALLAGARPDRLVLSSAEDRLHTILYTSGTTGRPKGAMLLDSCRIAALTMSLSEEYAPGQSDGMIHAGPLTHGSGSKVLTYFSRGARNVVLQKFDPGAFWRAVEESGGTSSFVVPTMIRMLIDDLASTGRRAPERLANLSYGGAGISAGELSDAIETFGGRMTQVYGLSEVPHPIAVLRHRDVIGEVPTYPVVPAGHPVSGVETRIGGTESSQRGELYVRGANVMAGYWNQPEATAQTIDADGWFRTGDAVEVDSLGRIYIVDRTKDLIISGGMNVYPAEVERVIREHPAVVDVCVVGVPSEKWGETVAAAVVTSSPTGEDDVASWCAGRLADYKRPRIIMMADALPQGSTGKIQKRSVREMVARTR